jgi:lactoylglutathione lyase
LYLNINYRLITKHDFAENKFTLYFLAYVDSIPEDEAEKKKLAFSLSGVLELTQ